MECLLDTLKFVFNGCKKKDKVDELLKKILYGEDLWKSHLNDGNIKSILNSIHIKLPGTNNHLARIKLMDKLIPEFYLEDMLEKLDNAFGKDEIKANKFKDKARNFYDASDFEMAIRSCNLALLFAPSNSNLTGFLFADRALFLHSIKDWTLSTQDISFALTLLNNSAPELCEELIKLQKITYELKNIPGQLDLSECQQIQTYRDDVLFKIYGKQNPMIPSGGDYIKIVQDPYKGRIIIVTKDIKAGTTVIVEDPYVSVLTEITRWELKHCVKCYKLTHAMIPCPDCTFATYCSEKCQLKDYEDGHQYECFCMMYFHKLEIPCCMHIAFKAICKAGPKYMYELYTQSISTIIKSKKIIKGCNHQTGKYDSNSYNQIYNLISHCHTRLYDIHVWYSYIITKILEMRTDFFRKIPPSQKENFIYFIGTTFLHHAVSIPYNLMGLWVCEKNIKRPKKWPHLEKEIEHEDFPGMNGIYSLTSLLSHSCDPNVIRVNLQCGKLAIITNRSLKSGDELLLSYGYDYATHKSMERFTNLYERYNFQCNCLPCSCGWPIQDELIQNEYNLLCPNCSSNFTYINLCKFHKCDLKIRKYGFGFCNHCGENFKLMTLENDIKKHAFMLKAANSFVLDSRPLDAIPILISCIEFFQTRIVSPSKLLLDAQSLLLTSYDCIATY